MPREIKLTLYPLHPDTHYYDDSVGSCRPKSLESGRETAREAMESGYYEYCTLSWLDDDGTWKREDFHCDDTPRA